MARTTTPSFVRDPDQAAEAASLFRDDADDLAHDLGERRSELSRSEIIRRQQTIDRYRRWADELTPPVDEIGTESPSERPTHIRPARDYPQASGDA